MFAVLIAFIFIFNAFNNIAQIGTSAKFRPTLLGQGCKCEWNRTEDMELSTEAKITKGRCQFQPMLNLMKIKVQSVKSRHQYFSFFLEKKSCQFKAGTGLK